MVSDMKRLSWSLREDGEYEMMCSVIVKPPGFMYVAPNVTINVRGDCFGGDAVQPCGAAPVGPCGRAAVRAASFDSAPENAAARASSVGSSSCVASPLMASAPPCVTASLHFSTPSVGLLGAICRRC